MLAGNCRVRLSVRVPRGAAGDVEGGVRELLERVDGVDRIEVCQLEGVRPDALDLYVDARVAVSFEAGVNSPRAQLQDGFGVLDVAVE